MNSIFGALLFRLKKKLGKKNRNNPYPGDVLDAKLRSFFLFLSFFHCESFGFFGFFSRKEKGKGKGKISSEKEDWLGILGIITRHYYDGY